MGKNKEKWKSEEKAFVMDLFFAGELHAVNFSSHVSPIFPVSISAAVCMCRQNYTG